MARIAFWNSRCSSRHLEGCFTSALAAAAAAARLPGGPRPTCGALVPAVPDTSPCPAAKVRLLCESKVRRCFWPPQIDMCLPMRSMANVLPQCPHGMSPAPPPSLENSCGGGRATSCGVGFALAAGLPPSRLAQGSCLVLSSGVIAPKRLVRPAVAAALAPPPPSRRRVEAVPSRSSAGPPRLGALRGPPRPPAARPRPRFCGQPPMWAASSSCEYIFAQYGQGVSILAIFLAHCCA